MPVTYQLARDAQDGEATIELLREVAEAYHPDLCLHGVTYDVLFALAPRDDNGMVVGDPLKKNGVPALALVRVVGLADRTKGMADVEIRLDGERWPELSEAVKRATLDHELTHLALSFDSDEDLKRDDLGRPRLRLRPHDWELGGFDWVVSRHRGDAVETIQLRETIERIRQLELEFDGGENDFRSEIAGELAAVGVVAK
jgi:hypothetical protein